MKKLIIFITVDYVRHPTKEHFIWVDNSEKYRIKTRLGLKKRKYLNYQLIVSSRCHGEKGNKVFELANTYNLLGRPDSEETKCFVYKGTSSEEAEKIIDILENAVTVADKNNTKAISECLRDA